MKYVATVEPVREVVLLGTADRGVWEDVLAPHGMSPVEADGAAQVLVGVFGARWMGIPFREAVVSVAARNEAGREAHFLVAGFNANRFFAWAERSRFKTPYRHARVELDPADAAHFKIDAGSEGSVAASMGEAPEASRPVKNLGTVQIRIPHARDAWFAGLLEGTQQASAFREGTDVFQVQAAPERPLHLLVASGFRPQMWRTATASRHARSKTFRGPLPTTPVT